MANKYQTLVNGRETMVEATVLSTGATQGGAIVALDTTGKLDPSVLPIGVGPDVLVAPATEALTAGNYVNIYSASGTLSVRRADASNDRQAHGFVTAAVTAGQPATIYFEGANAALSGLTPGARMYLGAAGAPTATVPSVGTSVIHQYLGVAVSTTAVNTDIEDVIVL